MPEQKSSRGDATTKGTSAGPFETQIIRYGVGGLNLQSETDQVPPEQATRLVNLDHDTNGAITSRLGQTTFATAGTQHHSAQKLAIPATSGVTRIWGVDSSLYAGASGALGLIDTGYSGDPLALAPHRPPLSGDPWMFVGDRSRMRKVRASDNLVLQIGLPAPTVAATTALGTEYRRTIAHFDATDSTDAAHWTSTAGTDADGLPADPPTTVDNVGQEGNCLTVLTHPGTIADTYDSWTGCPITLDLSTLSPVSGGGGSIDATDDDIVHLWIKTSHPWLVRDLRFYVVVAPTFNPAIVPGTVDASGSFANSDAYVKSFRSNDFVQFVQAKQTQIDAAETARVYAVRDQDQQSRAYADRRGSWEVERAATDPGRNQSLQIGSGVHQWFELGSIGIALRRGDFKRIGNTTGRDWSTVTGLLIYVKLDIDSTSNAIEVDFDDCYLTGGFGPDTIEVGAQQYDHRYTHYDPRTGAESNGSPEMVCANWIDSRRQAIDVTPTAFGDSAMRQRVYRRGGSLVDDWFFEGQNSSDGGVFSDTLTDDAISAAGSLPTDHFQPVPTVDNLGATVLAQPVPALWGPIQGMLLACGDPYRPGHLYWSLPDSPDHWSAESNKEICPPSEELMNGGLVGNQAFVFSRSRLYMLYPALTADATVDYQPSACTRGIQSRWAFCVGPGGLIYFVVENEGLFRTGGGAEEWLSRDVDPLFVGETRSGYLPIDWTQKAAIRLTSWGNRIYLAYQDTGGTRHVLVYLFLQQVFLWDTFGRALSFLQGEDESTLLLGGQATGKTYLHSGTSDDGLAISASHRTGSFSGGRREEKLFADQFLDVDPAGLTITVQNFRNEETTADGAVTVTGTGRARKILDPFGTDPESAHSIATEVSWSTTGAAPFLYQIGYSIALLPELTNKRVTNWDDLGSPDEVWLTGITLDVDTSNVARTILVEADYAGTITTIATLTVQANGRHKLAFSWTAVAVRAVRLRPTDANPWLIFRADWISQPEPPRIAGWDVHFENQWDQYYTGLDLYCDTGGLPKQIEVSVDGTILTDAATGLAYWIVTTTGRRVVHLTLPWGRGHVFRFRALDANPGLLYEHRWHTEPEPTEQANWTQNFNVYGTRADKYLKAVIFECDTFDQTKSVTVEADGVVVETLAVRANGRKVVQVALTAQALGRVWRLFPVDGNPGRLYSIQPIFDEEPFALARWETQELTYSLPGWFTPLYGYITLKATRAVTLTLQRQYNQRGATKTETYVIPATGGVKTRQFVTFEAGKDVLHKWILTSALPFWLYREETEVTIQPWGGGAASGIHIFGDDDLDPTRPMTNASFAAEAPGGSLGR